MENLETNKDYNTEPERNTMNKFPVKFKRNLYQEQTVYLESEHSVEDIEDWFENDGLTPRSYHFKKEIPTSVDLIQKELTEEGWENTDYGDCNKPRSEGLGYYENESVPTPEGFVGKYDHQIDEYLREKPKNERKEYMKNQRSILKDMESNLEEWTKEFVRRTQHMSEGLSTLDYSQLDKSEKKLVDDFYKFSPYHNPLGLENYNS
tara:strand:- start:297 stop:914 length:618 start_codon:yes stop_codon:yes gene_type:complete